jgi:hypothetical protein
VRELGEKYSDEQLKVNDFDATTDENKPKQKALGFQSHGLVIVDHQGKEVFKQADHAVKKDEVIAFVADYLKKH